MTERPVIIGMNNPVSDDPGHALFPLPPGCTGHRLYEMLRAEMGATQREYLHVFDRRNLVIGEWRLGHARENAALLLPSLAGRHVVLLGREVVKAFQLPRMQAGAVHRAGDATFYQLPHPSGRNPWYNAEENRRIASELLGRLYREYVDALVRQETG